MRDKIKDFIQTILFIFLLFLVFILNIIKKDEEISISERRKLSSFPEISFQSVMLSDFGKNFDNYTMDQIVFRDKWRSLKTKIELDFFNKKDNNKLYIINDSIYKIEYPIKENSIKNAAKKIIEIKEKYLKNSDVYYAIIPDKSFYNENEEYLKINHEEIVKIMNNNINGIKYIEISDCFNADSYYRTDLHIKQEEYKNAVDKILVAMGNEKADFSKYNKEKITDFYGSYYGQILKEIEKDEIYVLKDENTENSVTYNYESKEFSEVYNMKKITSNDLYDIFLSGPVPILDINNENSNSKKELIIFRDSFGSAFAPLLLQKYKKITLIDIRYISTNILNQYVNFDNKDVLFLYNDLILNNSSILR